jgi:autotransporter-associated beta strand protein
LGSALALQNSAYDTASVNGGLDVTGFATPTLGGLTGSANLTSTLISGYGSISTLTLNPQTGITNTYSGDVGNGNGSMALTKTGAGTQVLSGTNTYTGATTITTGTLQLDGSTHASSAVDIGTAGILSGSGTVNGNATLTGGGIINKSAGSIAGTLAVTGGNWNGAGAVTGAVTSSSGTFTIGSGSNLTSTAGVSATGGALVVNGTLTGTLDVASGATLGGSGTIAGALEISGNLAPGASGVDIQTLAAGATTWNGGSIWNFDLSTASGSSDKLAITDDFTKGSAGAYKFDFMGSAPNAWGNAYTLVTWTVGTTFELSDFSFQNLGGSYNVNDNNFSFSGNSLVFTAVPEPTSALAGLLLTAGLLRRKRNVGC